MDTCIEVEKDTSSVRLNIQRDEKYLSFKEVFHLWKTDNAFITFYTQALLQKIGNAFFWEHPPLRKRNLDEAYEVILQKANSFKSLKANATAFKPYFEKGKQVVVFDNLGKNARLVVPIKLKESERYKHLGIFLERAEQAQVHALFKEVGTQILQELDSGKCIWLNTAGLGVIWLHVRLDTRPKYYKTKKYKSINYFEKA